MRWRMPWAASYIFFYILVMLVLPAILLQFLDLEEGAASAKAYARRRRRGSAPAVVF